MNHERKTPTDQTSLPGDNTPMKDHSQSSDVSTAVKEKLGSAGIPYRWIDHQPVYTMQEAAEACGHEPEQGVKVLMVMVTRDGVDTPALVVWSGHKQVNLKSVAMQVNAESVKMAKPNQVRDILGIEVGALTPFGYESALPVFFDAALSTQSLVYINPGVHDASVELSAADLQRMIEGWSSDVTMIFEFKNI